MKNDNKDIYQVDDETMNLAKDFNNQIAKFMADFLAKDENKMKIIKHGTAAAFFLSVAELFMGSAIIGYHVLDGHSVMNILGLTLKNVEHIVDVRLKSLKDEQKEKDG